MSSNRWWHTLTADDIVELRRRVLAAVTSQFAHTPAAEVEDAVHHAFVALFRNREAISSDADGLFRYLLVAARRAALDRVKTERLRSARRPQVAQAAAAQADPGLPGDELEKKSIVREIFYELDELDRLILWSHVVEGRSINAIARETGRNWHQVAASLKQALDRIRRRLSE